MRVLLTNHALHTRAGSELYVRDLALALLARGHEPIVYSPKLGAVANELRQATIPVLDDVERLERPPDLIHAQHHLASMVALTRFPGVPAVYFCHGWLPAEEAPPDHPRIALYVAVDRLVRQRLVDECGIDAARVRVEPNFVDLERFRRRPPLPDRPRTALVFSNYVAEDNCLPSLREACRELGVEIAVIGLQETGTQVPDPERHLLDYDVVFAKGRAALEAAVVGAAVVVCDKAGLGPLVTLENLDHVRAYNFGVRLLRDPVTPEGVIERLRHYDASNAAAVTSRLRSEAGLDASVERILGLYREAVQIGTAGEVSVEEEARALARYLRHGPLTGGDFHRVELDRLRVELGVREREVRALRRELGRAKQSVESEGVERRGELQSLREERDRASATAERWKRRAEAEATRARSATYDVDWMRRTATWRLRDRILAIPGLESLYRRWRHGRKRSGSSGEVPEARAPGEEVASPGAGIQARAEAMIDRNGFLGVPRNNFEAAGRAQFTRLLEHGLTPRSKVLEIGCGCLRVGCWLIRFLEAGGYRGIEPATRRVELGRQYLLSPDELARKEPRFSYRDDFDTSVFSERFDYFLAGSIWTHCSKRHVETMLDGFLRDTGPTGVFLTSYLPAEGPEDDYMGGEWVGTSHVCDTPGVIRHSLHWICDACDARGLELTELPGLDSDRQLWLRIERSS